MNTFSEVSALLEAGVVENIEWLPDDSLCIHFIGGSSFSCAIPTVSALGVITLFRKNLPPEKWSSASGFEQAVVKVEGFSTGSKYSIQPPMTMYSARVSFTNPVMELPYSGAEEHVRWLDWIERFSQLGGRCTEEIYENYREVVLYRVEEEEAANDNA